MTTLEDTNNTNDSTTDSLVWCGHYKSGCKLITKCCNKEFGCRFCHDNADDSHTMNRYEIEEIVCNKCKMRQPVSNSCINENCDNKKFAEYYCDICHLYSENHITEIYHCDKCKICRICSLGNNKDNYYHCDKCGGCILGKLKDTHKCVTDVLKGDCCICLDSIFLSKTSARLLPCGHAIHGTCLEGLLKNNKTSCPLCRKTMLEGEALKSLIRQMDNIIESNPFQFSNNNDVLIKIKCNDCDFNDKVLYHPLGLKCGGCDGYNTIIDRENDN